MNSALNVRLCTRRTRNVIGSSPVSTTHTLLPIPIAAYPFRRRGSRGEAVAISFNARIRAVFPRGNPISPPPPWKNHGIYGRTCTRLHTYRRFEVVSSGEKKKRKRRKKGLHRRKKRALGGRLIRRLLRALGRLEKLFLTFLHLRFLTLTRRERAWSSFILVGQIEIVWFFIIF